MDISKYIPVTMHDKICAVTISSSIERPYRTNVRVVIKNNEGQLTHTDYDIEVTVMRKLLEDLMQSATILTNSTLGPVVNSQKVESMIGCGEDAEVVEEWNYTYITFFDTYHSSVWGEFERRISPLGLSRVRIHFKENILKQYGDKEEGTEQLDCVTIPFGLCGNLPFDFNSVILNKLNLI